MWDKKENDIMYRNQNTNFDSVSSEIPNMQSMRFRRPNRLDGQFFAEESRKRKFMDMDPGLDGVSASYLGNTGGGRVGHPLLRECPLPHNVTLPLPENSSMLYKHNSQHDNCNNAESPYGFQFSQMNNSSLALGAKGGRIGKASVGGFRPIQHKESSFPVLTPIEVPENLDSKHFVCDMAYRDEPSNFSQHSRSHSGFKESSLIVPMSDSAKTIRHDNDRLPCSPYPYPFSTPSYNTTSLGSLNLTTVNENFQSDVRSFDQKYSKSGLSDEKCVQESKIEESKDISVGKTFSTVAPAYSEGREAYNAYQNQVAYNAYQYHDTGIRPGSSDNHDSGARLNLGEQNSLSTPQMLVQAESSAKEGNKGHDSGGMNQPSEANTSLGSNDIIAGLSFESDDRLPLNAEECAQSTVSKVTPWLVEKLWEGSFQLNTSTTVSAVAFFKSGEKAYGTKWPEHIEIKGKVRLHAFEKYIQELPHSRSRALMVISLCWKPGSSKAGLAAMKEVARGYKESQRVGFAQISPGFDLYVCPRNDTIITILAKYGFFKGMAALEDDLDSLIGCVIWRRSLPSSIPLPKITEKKKIALPDQQPLNSQEPSVPEINSPMAKVDEKGSKQEKPPRPYISTLGDNDIQTVNNSSCISGCHQIDGAAEVPHSLPYSSPLVQAQSPAKQKIESSSLEENTVHTENPIAQAAEPKKHGGGSELLQPIRSGPPQMLEGVQQQPTTHFRNSSLNPWNSIACLPPKPGASISANFSFLGPQQSTAKNLDPRSNSNPVLVQANLPGPPSLTADILHRFLQFSKEECKAPTEGMPKADVILLPSGELEKPIRGSEAVQQPADIDDDDDSDLPEFDFDSACGVPKATASKYSESGHQEHITVAPFKQEVPIGGVKNKGRPAPPLAARPTEVWQAPHASVISGRTLDNCHGSSISLPIEFGGLNSEKKRADIPSLSQQLVGKATSSSPSRFKYPLKSRWDDDDDMPEWCPPELVHADVPKPKPPSVSRPAFENAKQLPAIPPSSMASFSSSPQTQSLTQGYHPGNPVRPPFIANPAPVHQRSAVGFVPNNFRHPQVPHLQHSVRPSATNFGTKPPNTDVSRQWKRP